MEDVSTTEGKITATTKVSTTETIGSKLASLSLTGRISQLGQHLYILQISHTYSDPPTEERTVLQWYVTFKKMHQEKPLTLLSECL